MSTNASHLDYQLHINIWLMCATVTPIAQTPKDPTTAAARMVTMETGESAKVMLIFNTFRYFGEKDEIQY